ncbi:MAG: methyltransferase domain-containing protein [bacterium]|nr:methyltransferase domain-containing protein [bacterium]
MSKSRWNAESYSKTSGLQDNIAFKLINEKCKFKPNDKVLDIGCGDGAITRYIAELVPKGHVIGIDPSIEMISHCKEKSKNITNVDFMLNKAKDINFGPEFNWILSFVALHWEKELDKAFRNFYKALVEGGKFTATIVPYIARIHLPLFDTFRSKKWSPYLKEFKYNHYFYDTGGCQILLKQCGFKIDKVYSHSYDLKLSREKIIENFQSWAPINQIPIDLQNEFSNDFFNMFTKLMPQPIDEKYIYPVRLIHINATK